MQYLALIYAAPDNEPKYGTPDFKTMMDGYFAFTTFLKDKGAFIAGDGLKPDTITRRGLLSRSHLNSAGVSAAGVAAGAALLHAQVARALGPVAADRLRHVLATGVPRWPDQLERAAALARRSSGWRAFTG